MHHNDNKAHNRLLECWLVGWFLDLLMESRRGSLETVFDKVWVIYVSLIMVFMPWLGVGNIRIWKLDKQHPNMFNIILIGVYNDHNTNRRKGYQQV